jgi:SAM-dependent methyltransferase
MDPAAIDEMSALEDHHWWFVGKRLITRALLAGVLGDSAARLLDVGCGTGGVAASLADAARVVAVDRSVLALGHARRRGVRALAASDGDRLPFASGAFDVIIMLDVLEHFADERALLTEVRRCLRPSGALVVSVPAFQFLWSGHDEILHHVRRYTARRLRRALVAGGFRVERLTYTNVVPLPPALVVRGFLPRLGLGRRDGTDFRRHSALVNGVLVAAYRAEAALLRRVRLPLGLSVAAVARPAAA